MKVTMKHEVIEQFFVKWEAEMFQWFSDMKAEYKAIGATSMYEKYRDGVSKQNLEIIRTRLLHPRAGCGDSIQEIVHKDMASKKAALYFKIEGKVGAVYEVDLYCGGDGTPNGTVKGDLGMVRISTVLAGGYNIQCLHYRVLVK